MRKNMQLSAVRIALLALTLIGTRTVLADDSASGVPSNTVRAGLYDIFYHVNATDLSGPYVPAGVGLALQDVQTLYLAYVRHFWTHFDLELAAGWPPLTKTIGRGPTTLGSVPYSGQIISTARWFSPSLLLNYLFFDDSHALRPYIGVGLNYASFFDRDSTAAGNAASGGPTRLSLNASVGPVGTVGLSYRWSRNWSAYASYSVSDVHSHLTANTDGVIRSSYIDFGPQALILAVGYSF